MQPQAARLLQGVPLRETLSGTGQVMCRACSMRGFAVFAKEVPE
jgi:hypothetical protein